MNKHKWKWNWYHEKISYRSQFKEKNKYIRGDN